MAYSLSNKQALGLAAGLLAAMSAYVWFNWELAIPLPAGARAPSVSGVSSIPGGPQTPEYARLQQMADASRANRARETGGSAVPTPPELRPLGPAAPPAPAPSAVNPAAPSPAPAQSAQGAPPPDETERMTGEFARAMQDQTRQLVELRKRFEPEPTRMVTFEDIKGHRERAEAQKRSEDLLKEARAARPRDRNGLLQPGDILFAVLQTAINSDEPGPVRAKIVGERFKGAVLLGDLNPFPPVAGNRPERVLVKFRYLTTSGRVTYPIDAYAIDLETARTALATGVDHHYLERYGALLAASFLEGYGEAIRNNNRIATVGVFGNVVSVPKNDLGHGEIAREALGTVGQRLGGAVAENFRRPNTVTVESGTGLGILIAAPAADHREDQGEGEGFRAGPTARPPGEPGTRFSTVPVGESPTGSASADGSAFPAAARRPPANLWRMPALDVRPPANTPAPSASGPAPLDSTAE